MARMPFYQAIIQKVPLFDGKLAHLVGVLAGRRLEVVVNDVVMELDLREFIERRMFLGRYEPVQTQWFKECLVPGDTVLDVGASFGYYTTLGSQLVAANGRVFAFEPSPVPGKVVENALRDNKIENTLLTKAAVGREPGEVQLYLPNTEYMHSPSILHSDDSFDPIDIPVIQLDKFEPLANVQCIKLVKIDVEGYEPDVIGGMEGLIGQGRVENIICELNSGWLKRNNSSPEKLSRYIQSLGFHIHKASDLETNLPGHKGELFDLQDIWFKRSPA